MSTEDLPDFLSESAPAPEASPAPEAPPAGPDTQPGPARDDHGRFAPAAEPAAASEPAAAPAAAEPAASPQSVPLPTFLELRDRLSAAEREARDLRTWREQQEAHARAQPVPDRFEDPEAYEQHRDAQFANQLYEQRVQMSLAVAEVRHGPEAVKGAVEWAFQRCADDPFFNQKMRASGDPVGSAVAEWKREQLLARVTPEDLDAFQAWKAGQAGSPAAPAAAAPAAPRTPPPPPRQSLADSPSAGAHSAPEARDGEAQFGAMFS